MTNTLQLPDGPLQIFLANENVIGEIGGNSDDADAGFGQRPGERCQNANGIEIQRSSHFYERETVSRILLPAVREFPGRLPTIHQPCG